MNTGKATWINHPKHVITTLHSFTYEGKDDIWVMFTIGEKDQIKLKVECQNMAKAKMVFIHTPNDYLAFSDGFIKGKLFSVEYNIPASFSNQITMVKDKEAISFVSDEKLLITISNSAFLGSASFGVMSEGVGKTYIEVF